MKLNITTGGIYLVNFPKKLHSYCLSGIHKCVVIKRFGSTVQVVPISSDRDNVHYGEVRIPQGVCGLERKSKLKVGQLSSVSIGDFIKYIGMADKQTLSVIRDFIQIEIVDFIGHYTTETHSLNQQEPV